MDKPSCGGGQSCCDRYQHRIRKLVGEMDGSVESFYQDAPPQHLQPIGDRGGDKTGTGGNHRVTLSLLLPCAGSGSGPREAVIRNPELAIAIPGRMDYDAGGGSGGGGDGSASDQSPSTCQGEDSDSSGESMMSSGCSLGSSSWDDEDDPLEYADIMPEAELNEILESFMESSEGLESYHGGSADRFTVTHEQLLHAAIDKHLSQSQSSSNSGNSNDSDNEWESPLFNRVEDDVTSSSSEELQAIQIKEEPVLVEEGEDEEVEEEEQEEEDDEGEDEEDDEGEEEEDDEGEEEMETDTSNSFPIQVQPLPQGVSLPRKFIPASSCSFATLTTVSAPPNAQPIRQQFIPQVTVPMSAVNQVAYAMAAAASQNQVLRPATLPPMSALVNGGGLMYPLNWAFAQNTFEIPTNILRANLRPTACYTPSRPSVLLPRAATSAATSGKPTLNTIMTRIRCRKTTPVPIKEMKNLTVARTHKEEVISQFAKLQDVVEGAGVPEGHTFESWILEEGLHKIRKLGLHRDPETDDYPFKCPLCDKKYRNPNGIKYHAKYGHGPKCIFTCPICQRDYATRHGLAAHRRTHLLTNEDSNLESTNQRKLKNIATIVIQAGPGRG